MDWIIGKNTSRPFLFIISISNFQVQRTELKYISHQFTIVTSNYCNLKSSFFTISIVLPNNDGQR